MIINTYDNGTKLMLVDKLVNLFSDNTEVTAERVIGLLYDKLKFDDVNQTLIDLLNDVINTTINELIHKGFRFIDEIPKFYISSSYCEELGRNIVNITVTNGIPSYVYYNPYVMTM